MLPRRHAGLALVSGVAALLLTGGCERTPAELPTRLIEVAVAQGSQAAERCEIDGDSREGFVLVPGGEVALTVRVPRGGGLHYGLATLDTGDGTPNFELVVEDPDGTVLTRRSEAPTRRWSRATLALDEWQTRRVVIRGRNGAPTAAPSARLCWAHPALMPSAHRGPVVAVLLLDTVRADHLALHGYARPNTPGLEALARDGIVFENATSDASWTRASVATLFTGQSALTHGVLSRDAHLDARWPPLAQRLRDAGFGTVAFSTNPNVLPFWGFATGFDRFVDVGAESWIENSDAAEVLEAGLAAVDDAGSSPLLLYLHLNDAHAPYDPPPFEATALLGRYDPASPGKTLTPKARPDEVRSAIARYDAEIAYLDARIARFLDGLRARSRFDDALIVVVGDHGEEFLEHGGVYHGHTLFREQLDVPLLVKLPHGAGAGVRTAEAATMQDVLPTVIAALGLPHEDLPGRVLLEADGRVATGTSLPRFAVADMDHVTAYAVEHDGLNLIVQTRPRPGTWVFDRERDPEQRRNVAGTIDLQRTAALRSLLDERLLAARAGWHVRVCGGPDPSSATVRLTSATPLARLERVDVESADSVEVGANGMQVTLTTVLTPQVHHEERFGKRQAVTRPDQDELVFGNVGPVTIEYTGGATLLVGGDQRPEPASGAVVLDVAKAQAPAVYAPTCPPEPALLVWHSGSTTATPPTDPDLERRLRAIGYLQ